MSTILCVYVVCNMCSRTLYWIAKTYHLIVKASHQLWWPQCHIPMFVTFCKGCCCCPNTNLDQCKWHLPPPFLWGRKLTLHSLPCQTWVHPKNQLPRSYHFFFIKLMSVEQTIYHMYFDENRGMALCTKLIFLPYFLSYTYCVYVITKVLHITTLQQLVLETLEFGPQVWMRGHTIAGNKRRGLCINGDNGDWQPRKKSQAPWDSFSASIIKYRVSHFQE